jgi:hypothetical protein
VNIHFNGAAQTVTGSQFCWKSTVTDFIDCGLYQGHRKDYYQRNRPSFNPAKLMPLHRMPILITRNLPNLVHFI